MGRKSDLAKDEASSKKAKAPDSAPGGSDTSCTFVDKIKNLMKNHFRGLLGTIVPIIVTIVFWAPKNAQTCMKLIWFWMFWFLLLHPVAVPTVSMISIFGFTLFGIMETKDLCKCFFNDGIALYILGGWISLGMICSNAHIRCIAKLMTSRELNKNEIIIKTSLTTYIMSMFTNRLIICEHMMKIVVNAMDADPAADENMKLILANVVTASATFGGLGFLHVTPCVIGLVSVVKGFGGSPVPFPDFMNYAEYSLRAIPLGLLMLLLNIIYSIVRAKKATFNPVSAGSVKQQVTAAKDELPSKASLHEHATMFFTAVMLISLIFRWSQALFGGMNNGWSPVDKASLAAYRQNYPQILDSTPVAAIVILMHMLPSTMGWTRYFKPMTQSSLPVLKPENGMLFFKFVDKRTHYGYMLLMGAALVLCKALNTTKYNLRMMTNKLLINILENHTWAIVLIITISSCLMTSIAVIVVVAPFMTAIYFKNNVFYIALASSFGLTSPFYYTPAYYFKTIAGFNLLQQIKTAIPTVIIAAGVLMIYSFIGGFICWEICTHKKLTGAATTPSAGGAPADLY